MNILYHVLFFLWIFCLEVCLIAVTVGTVWMVYSIVKTDKKDRELSPEDFIKRVAYHMGLPEDQYGRLTYTKLGLATRIDFDGGRPEFHQISCFIGLTEEVARRTGYTFSTMYQKAWKSVEDGIREAEDGHSSH